MALKEGKQFLLTLALLIGVCTVGSAIGDCAKHHIMRAVCSTLVHQRNLDQLKQQLSGLHLMFDPVNGTTEIAGTVDSNSKAYRRFKHLSKADQIAVLQWQQPVTLIAEDTIYLCDTLDFFNAGALIKYGKTCFISFSGNLKSGETTHPVLRLVKAEVKEHQIKIAWVFDNSDTYLTQEFKMPLMRLRNSRFFKMGMAD